MRFALRFKKYFSFVKIQLLILGLWPYENHKLSNVFKTIWILGNVFSLFLQESIQINENFNYLKSKYKLINNNYHYDLFEQY